MVWNLAIMAKFIYYKELKLHLVTKSYCADFHKVTTFPWIIYRILYYPYHY